MSVPPISPLVLQDPSVISVEQTSGQCRIRVSSPNNPVSVIAFPILTQTSSASRSTSEYGRQSTSLLKQAVKNAAIVKCYEQRRRRRREHREEAVSLPSPEDYAQQLEAEYKEVFSTSGSSSS